MTEWHGWSVAGAELHIGPLPGTTSIALYKIELGRLTRLAYFRNKECAREALWQLDLLAGGYRVDMRDVAEQKKGEEEGVPCR